MNPSNPNILAVMLVSGRASMVARAVRSFQAQTYQARRLFVLDTGVDPVPVVQSDGVYYEHMPELGAQSIGRLRNAANAYADPACLNCDVICHFDSDDLSHPRRIEEQVALLQASGKACVGYSDMLFWDETEGHLCGAWLFYGAWLYTGQPKYCLGTSLAYWRETWEKRPFEDLPKGPTGRGEDAAWLAGISHLGVSSLTGPPDVHGAIADRGEARMIASLHGSNTSHMASLAIKVGDRMMKRVQGWDFYCRDRMRLDG